MTRTCRNNQTTLLVLSYTAAVLLLCLQQLALPVQATIKMTTSKAGGAASPRRILANAFSLSPNPDDERGGIWQ